MTLFVICLIWFLALAAAALLPMHQGKRAEKALFVVAWFLVILIAFYLGPLGGAVAVLAVLSVFQDQLRILMRWRRIRLART
jgi:hypothetical protein